MLFNFRWSSYCSCCSCQRSCPSWKRSGTYSTRRFACQSALGSHEQPAVARVLSPASKTCWSRLQELSNRITVLIQIRWMDSTDCLLNMSARFDWLNHKTPNEMFCPVCHITFAHGAVSFTSPPPNWMFSSSHHKDVGVFKLSFGWGGCQSGSNSAYSHSHKAT